MRSTVITRDPAAVELEVQRAFLTMFPEADPMFVPRIFGWVVDCFCGGFRDYQPVDAGYHDFEHTLQGTLCMSRLLLGRRRAGATPMLDETVTQLGLIAMLLHDSGYLKKEDDKDGTGAKYTVVHVDRSAAFAQELLSEKDFPTEQIRAVQNMIRCTGVNVNLQTIPFIREEERIAGLALGTADYLGQMAADDYIEKLPTLYDEFVEANEFSGGAVDFIAGFHSASDLIRKTPTFWEKFVLPKLESDFRGLYRFLNDPYPDGPNWYVQRIELNVERARRMAQS